MASLEAEGLAPKFHLCDLANLATVEALRDTMVERLGECHVSDVKSFHVLPLSLQPFEHAGMEESTFW